MVKFSTSKSSFQKEASFEVLDNQNHVFLLLIAIFKVTNAVPNPELLHKMMLVM